MEGPKSDGRSPKSIYVLNLPDLPNAEKGDSKTLPSINPKQSVFMIDGKLFVANPKDSPPTTKKKRRGKSEGHRGTQCFVPNCRNYNNKQSTANFITFHKFPNKEKKRDLYDAWVKNCDRDIEPTIYAKICSSHFLPEQIIRPRGGMTLTRLAEDAVPTIFQGLEQNGTSAEDTSAKDTSAKDTSAKDTSAKDTSAKDTSAKDTSAKDTSVKDASAKDTSNEPVGQPVESMEQDDAVEVISSVDLETESRKIIQRKTKSSNIRVCEVCRKPCKGRASYACHMRSHTGERPYECDLCKKNFNSSSHLNRHMLSHTGEKPHECPICHNSYATSDILKAHIRRHTGEKPYKCLDCKKAFYTYPNYHSHLQTHAHKRRSAGLACPNCDKAFHNAAALKSHMKRPLCTALAKHQCNDCGKRFSQESSLCKHLDNHSSDDKPYRCNICCKSYSQSRNLRVHMQVHSDVSKYVCSVCSKKFKLAISLKNHMRKHNEDKRHKCPICHKAFSFIGYLKMHLMKAHIIHLEVPKANDNLILTEVDSQYEGGPIDDEVVLSGDPSAYHLQTIQISDICTIDNASEAFLEERPSDIVDLENSFTPILMPAVSRRKQFKMHTVEKPELCPQRMSMMSALLQQPPNINTHDYGRKPREKAPPTIHTPPRIVTLKTAEGNSISVPFDLQVVFDQAGDSVSVTDLIKISDPGLVCTEEAIKDAPVTEDEPGDSSGQNVEIIECIDEDYSIEQAVEETTTIIIVDGHGTASDEGNEELHVFDSWAAEGETESEVIETQDEAAKPSPKKKERLKCPLCYGKYASLDSLKRHIQNVHLAKDETLTCNVCSESFLLIDDLIEHRNQHKEEVLLCGFCSKTFKGLAKLEKHMEIHSSVVCVICKKTLYSRHSLKNHMMTHTGEKPHQCPVCNKAFKLAYQAKNHMLVHTGEKPYVCETCGKGFSQASHLKTHIRLHTGEKPYLCNTCGTSYRHKDTFNKHLIAHAEGRKTRPRLLPRFDTTGFKFIVKDGIKHFTCPKCNKVIKRSQSLRIHMRQHSGEKPFKCQHCDRTFAQRAHLVSHTRTHTGERPYKCSACGRAFALTGNLRAHMKVHSKGS